MLILHNSFWGLSKTTSPPVKMCNTVICCLTMKIPHPKIIMFIIIITLLWQFLSSSSVSRNYLFLNLHKIVFVLVLLRLFPQFAVPSIHYSGRAGVKSLRGCPDILTFDCLLGLARRWTNSFQGQNYNTSFEIANIVSTIQVLNTILRAFIAFGVKIYM